MTKNIYIPETSDYAIAVGPQHPTHKEPIRFIFQVKGETVEDVLVRIGFNHRGIEKAFESRTWIQNLYLAERLCGICSNAHQLAYAQAAEKCANLYDEVPMRAKYIRVIMGELERIQSHMLWYGVLAHDTGYDTAFHLVWRDREIVSDILEIISGNRVNYSMLTLGGVRRDISKDIIDKIRPMMLDLKKRCEYHYDFMMSEKSFLVRQKGVAILTKEDAKKYCSVGPTARASGVPYDIRKVDPHAAYEEFDFRIPLGSSHGIEGDILGGCSTRIDETIIACEIILDALDNLPQGDIVIKVPKRIEANEGMSRIEAPRGEDMHYVRSNGTDKPDRHKIRAPTLANISSLAHRLVGCQIADIPPVIRVIDPCIGCMERTTFINSKNGKKIDLTKNQFISRANRAYRSGSKVLNEF